MGQWDVVKFLYQNFRTIYTYPNYEMGNYQKKTQPYA